MKRRLRISRERPVLDSRSVAIADTGPTSVGAQQARRLKEEIMTFVVAYLHAKISTLQRAGSIKYFGLSCRLRRTMGGERETAAPKGKGIPPSCIYIPAAIRRSLCPYKQSDELKDYTVAIVLVVGERRWVVTEQRWSSRETTKVLNAVVGRLQAWRTTSQTCLSARSSSQTDHR